MAIEEKLLRDSVRSLKVWRVWLFLAQQDIKSRFRGSFIGPLWILLNIAIFVGGAGVVYGLMFGQPMKEFLPFLTIGLVIWGFLVSSLTESGVAFVNAEGYIKQFAFPKQIYLFRPLVVYSIVMAIGFSALFVLQLLLGSLSLVGWVFSIPGLFILLVAGLGHIVICAYLGTRFRDLPHALAGGLQVVFFVTPILFPVKVLKERGLDFVYQYNPLYYLIEVVRHPIIAGELPQFDNYIPAVCYVCFIWLAAFFVAKRFDSRLVYML